MGFARGDAAAWKQCLRDTPPRPAALQPEERTFEGRPQIRFLIGASGIRPARAGYAGPRYQYALWPSQTVIWMDQPQNGMDLICGVSVEQEDTLYRIDAVSKAADGRITAPMPIRRFRL